jgi:hypothetical protein
MLWLPLGLGAGVDHAMGWISNLRKSKRLCLLQNRPRLAMGPTQPRIPWVQEFDPGWVNRPGSEVDHFHLVPKLKMSGVLLLLPLHAFMLCTGTTLPFFFFTSKCRHIMENYHKIKVNNYVYGVCNEVITSKSLF